jgi:REP element-mobilizing transposase RayT
MARPVRVEFPGAWYHVTSRGNARRDIFQSDQDRQKYLSYLASNLEEFRVRCHAFVLMDNHIHLLLETLEGHLSRFMQNLNTSYATWFNRRHESCGHLLQGRYKAILIEEESYLQTVARYVHLNPVRIHSAENLGADAKLWHLRNYIWSSYRGFGWTRGRPKLLACDRVLSAWGGDSPEGRKRYREYVEQGVFEKEENPFKALKEQFVLGGQRFVDWVYETYLSERKTAREQPQVIRLRPSVSADRIAASLAQEYNVGKEALLAPRKHSGVARQMLIVLALEYRDRAKSLRDLADQLGGISVSALSQARRRFLDRLKETPKLQHQFDRMKAAIEKSIVKV